MSSPYIPNTDEDRRMMMQAIGIESAEELFADIPEAYRHPALNLPPPLSELELKRKMAHLAATNINTEEYACFLGGGAYRHFIPSVVGHITGRSEFYTAYTPYQPEASQGTLQALFDYQSLICALTGMEVSNAGLYDGPTALAEAALMACRLTGRRNLILLSTVDPRYQEVVATYANAQGLPVETYRGGPLPLGDSPACLMVQQPNFFGYLEDLEGWAKAAHDAGALLVVVVDLISLGLYKSPREYGADIVVAEGQPLGNALNFGGPYLGVMACRQEYIRQLPGRLVGRATDAQGRVGYVLTLQTREQHIRRERATSNVCTSESLMAIAAAVYLSALGPRGLRQVAELCYHKAHYAADHIAHLPGYVLPFAEQPFFKEFVVRCPLSPKIIHQRLLEAGIIGGLDISDSIENGMLLCVTELNTREEIDRLVSSLKAIGAGEARVKP